LKNFGFYHRKNGCLISSLANNWDLDTFIKRFICGRWYIHLEQTIYHLCRPITIPSGWLSSPVVNNHPQWLIMITISRTNHHRCYSSPLNEYRFHRMNIVCSRWISSPSDEYHLLKLNIVCSSWISSPSDEYHLF
jgi:hypothetical protein